MLSYFSLPGDLPLSPSPSLSPHHSLLLRGSHCSSAGHKCIHRSFNRQLNQEDSSIVSYLPWWDPEKLLKGGKDANWIHFPCVRVGYSLRTQHQQLLLGFCSLALWLAMVWRGTTLPASLEHQQSRRQEQRHHHLPPPSRRMGWAQKQPGTCSRHLLWLLLSCPLPQSPTPAAVEAACPGSCWLSWQRPMVSHQTKGEGKWVKRAAGAGGEWICAAALWDALGLSHLDSGSWKMG